jgi:hypothetical protein
VSLEGVLSLVAYVRRPDGSIFAREATPDPDQTAHPGVWTLPLIEGDLTMPGHKWKVNVRVEWAAGRYQTFGPEDFPVKDRIG